MFTLAATDTFSGGASVASQLTCSIYGMELTAGPTETYKTLYQGQLASSPATLYTVPASTTAFIKSISVVNNDTTARTIQFFSNIGGSGVAAADAVTSVVSIPAGGFASYEDGKGWEFFDSSGNLQVTTIATVGSSYVSRVNADVANATTTNAAITDLDQVLGPGTYKFQYLIRWTTSIVTTGIKFAVDHTGTVTFNLYNMLYVDVSATAATGAPSQAANASTAQVYAAYSSRADNGTLGPTLSADSTNDMLIVIDGLLLVTASGTLRLMHGSETAATTTVKIGTSCVVNRTA